MASNISKVIYFDESSALDFLDLLNDGRLITSLEEISSVEDSAETKIASELSIGVKILSFFKANASVNAGLDAKTLSNTILNSTISNTILTDFLKQKDKKPILEFKDIYVYPYKNSISYLKCFTPYLMVLKNDLINGLNINSFNSVLEDAKGYYELLFDKDEEISILRFNIKSFRNNYCLSDLMKMKLTYYAIEVGECDLSKLEINNELSFNTSKNTISSTEILEQKENIEKKVKLYDVILAGVNNE